MVGIYARGAFCNTRQRSDDSVAEAYGVNKIRIASQRNSRSWAKAALDHCRTLLLVPDP